MISKELLSEVLGVSETKDIVSFGLGADGNLLIQYKEYDDIFNIYELAHKCKEWAFNKGISINIFKSDSMYYEATPMIYNDKLEEWVEHPYSIAETEPEAVFKACQWILYNKDNHE